MCIFLRFGDEFHQYESRVDGFVQLTFELSVGPKIKKGQQDILLAQISDKSSVKIRIGTFRSNQIHADW